MGQTITQSNRALGASAIQTARPTGPIMRIAMFGERDQVPPVVASLRQASGCDVTWAADPARLAQDVTRQIDVALLIDAAEGKPGVNDDAGPLNEICQTLRKQRIAAVALTRRPWLFASHGSGVVCQTPDVGIERLLGALSAMAHLRPVMRQIDLELASMEHLGTRLVNHFTELDQELRLAARLQQDFLPRQAPADGRLRFATIFRPCSCVSGDFFDIVRLDDHHVAFYIADAMGHGVAAGLLTMFIKNAIQMTRPVGNGVEILPPREVLQRLNDALVRQALPDSQFITAWYGIIDTRTLQLTYACGGHPPPVLTGPDGVPVELTNGGCLLGIFADQAFDDHVVELRPGQRLLLFSDGLSGMLFASAEMPDAACCFAPGIEQIIGLAPPAFVERLIERLDMQPGSLQSADDISLVLVDVVA